MVFVRVHVISSFPSVPLFYSTTACAMNAVYQSDHLKRCVVAEEKERGKGSRERVQEGEEKKTPRDQRHLFSFVCFRTFVSFNQR